jgi:hypothetical protein
VSLDDWILALHVLSAFAFVAGVVLFWVLIVAVRRMDTPDRTIGIAPIVSVGNAAVGVGAGGTIVFGIWLAISLDAYQPWDGWVLAAIVLWIFAAATGQRTGAEYLRGYTRAQELEASGQTGPNGELLALNRTSRGLFLHALTSAIVLLLLIDMVWKPGA